MARGAEGAMASSFFRNLRIFETFNVSSERFRTFAIGKDKDFEFYQKIFELGPSNLHVPRRPCFGCFSIYFLQSGILCIFIAHTTSLARVAFHKKAIQIFV